MNRPAVLDHDQSSPRKLNVSAALATVALLVVFAILAVLVTARWTPLITADTSTDAAAHGLVLQHRIVLAVSKALDFLADDPTIYVITGLAIAVFLLRRRLRAAIYLAVAKLIQVAVEPLVKDVVGRPRPALPDPVAFGEGFSFPSGHATRAATLVVSLLILWLVTSRSRRPAAPVAIGSAVIGVVLVVAIVAVSRVLLGVHYPSDVVAGALLGTACALAAAPVLFTRRAAAISHRT